MNSHGMSATGATNPAPGASSGTLPGVQAALRADGIRKSFTLGDGSQLEILKGIDLEVGHGEAVSIIGQSGSGKSTLLHILGALDHPTAGSVQVGSQQLSGLGNDELAAIRNRSIGFVFQFHHLLREFTAVENAMMPCLIRGESRAVADAKAREVLEAVGLGHRLEHKPWQLSGGEQQRVAVARALVNQPVVLLADEPTGNLDDKTSDQLHDMLFRIREERALSMVLVTHNLQLASRSDRTLLLRDGAFVKEEGATHEV